jgi:hypothetical protein
VHPGTEDTLLEVRRKNPMEIKTMTTIEKLRAPRLQRPIIVACALAVLFVLPRWGGKAMMVGAALSLVIYSVIFDCHRVVRAILGCLALLACAAAAYFAVMK